MNDAFLMRVLDGVADLHEQAQPRLRREQALIAEVRDAETSH